MKYVAAAIVVSVICYIDFLADKAGESMSSQARQGWNFTALAAIAGFVILVIHGT